MNRTRTIKNTMSGLMSRATAAAAVLGLSLQLAQAKPVTIRIASVNPGTTESMLVVAKVAEHIQERTDGRFWCA